MLAGSQRQLRKTTHANQDLRHNRRFVPRPAACQWHPRRRAVRAVGPAKRECGNGTDQCSSGRRSWSGDRRERRRGGVRRSALNRHRRIRSRPAVDEDGQAVDADGNAIALEDLPAIPADEATLASPLVDENGQAVDADGNAIALEDLPVVSADAAALAPRVDEDGQAVDADGNANAVEDLPPPRTVVEWLSRQDFGQLFNFSE